MCGESYGKGAPPVDLKMTLIKKKKKKSIVETIAVRLKAKEMYSPIARGQENVTHIGYH